jgi:metal-dependent hydrolase (beta-lactamase superfamily II)
MRSCDVLLANNHLRAASYKGKESVYLLDVDFGEVSQCRLLHGHFDHVRGVLSDAKPVCWMPVAQETRRRLIYEMKYIYTGLHKE